MTKYEILKMLEELLLSADAQGVVRGIPKIDALIDIIQDEVLLEGERGHWPLQQQ